MLEDYIMDKNKLLLKDVNVLKYLIKNEQLILQHFFVPEGESPSHFLLRKANEVSNEITIESCKMSYSLPSLYVTSNANCVICKYTLEMKKSMNVILYDDVLGSSNITVLSKYCSSCKLTYYPGYFESFKEKKKIYYTEWTAYGVFISTYCSAFSIDLLDQLICMKQRFSFYPR